LASKRGLKAFFSKKTFERLLSLLARTGGAEIFFVFSAQKGGFIFGSGE
jgi:hypothetical protein